APTYTYKDTYALLENLYTSLLEQGKSITIFGDSAGGGIALGFVEELNEKGIQVPDKLILMSPLLDITGTNEEAYEYEAKDPLVTRYEVIVCGLAWAGDTDVYDYHVSPIYGDITNMPKTLVTMGSNEYLAKDIMKFYGIMRDNKQDIKLLYGDGLFHVFPFYPMPESDEANGIIAAFIRD
ncbi:MAG: alpha/beta hydrolase, partial [Lachnospiraceae bacterium]|nr:alpha/beta hydrolase [Lachnospiraceae bacterium]